MCSEEEGDTRGGIVTQCTVQCSIKKALLILGSYKISALRSTSNASPTNPVSIDATTGRNPDTGKLKLLDYVLQDPSSLLPITHNLNQQTHLWFIQINFLWGVMWTHMFKKKLSRGITGISIWQINGLGTPLRKTNYVANGYTGANHCNIVPCTLPEINGVFNLT